MLTTRQNADSSLRVRKMVITSMLSAISIFLGLTGLGFVPLPLFKLTILHIPVVIGAIVEGPIVGATIGLIFGLFSIYQNITAPTIMSPFFYNPIVSVLPRVLIGIVSYYIFVSIKRVFKTGKIGVGIAAILGSLTNTIGVLGFIYLFYFKDYANILMKKGTIVSDAKGPVASAILAIVGTNGLAESALCALITVPVVLAIFKMQKRKI